MQFKAALLSLFVALAAAKSVDEIVAEIPSCAKPCLDDASKTAGCDVDDHKCQCSAIKQITSNAVLCLTKGCSSDDLKTASKVSSELCVAVAAQAGGALTGLTATPTPTGTPSPTPSGGANQAGTAFGVVGAAAMFALAL